jgi:PAS domain S-box-containing protein
MCAGPLHVEEGWRMPDAVTRALLDVLVDDMEAAVAVIDRDLRFVVVNERTAALTGVPAADHEGRRITELVPNQAAAIENGVRAAFASGTPARDVPYHGLARGGSRTTWSVSWLPVSLDDGVVHQVVAVARDRTAEVRSRTDRALAEARLAIAELSPGSTWTPPEGTGAGVRQQLAAMGASLDMLFESSAIGMLLLSLDGRILRANLTFAAFVGRDVIELVGTSIIDLTAPQDLTITNQLLAGATSVHQIEKRYLRPDGRAVWARVTSWILNDDDGGPVCRVSLVASIDAEKAAEASGAPPVGS